MKKLLVGLLALWLLLPTVAAAQPDNFVDVWCRDCQWDPWRGCWASEDGIAELHFQAVEGRPFDKVEMSVAFYGGKEWRALWVDDGDTIMVDAVSANERTASFRVGAAPAEARITGWVGLRRYSDVLYVCEAR